MDQLLLHHALAKAHQPMLFLPPAGNQSGNLLWRLQHGETPDSEHQPTAAVVLIGTNDLNLAIISVRRGGLGVKDLTPCAVGIADRYFEFSDFLSEL